MVDVDSASPSILARSPDPNILEAVMVDVAQTGHCCAESRPTLTISDAGLPHSFLLQISVVVMKQHDLTLLKPLKKTF